MTAYEKSTGKNGDLMLLSGNGQQVSFQHVRAFHTDQLDSERGLLVSSRLPGHPLLTLNPVKMEMRGVVSENLTTVFC